MKNIPLPKVTGDLHKTDEFNSYVAECENLVTDTNIPLDTNDSHQFGQSVSAYATTGNYFIDSGIVNALNLVSSQYNFQTPQEYYDGMIVRCIPANTNTGPSTLSITGLGSKAIKLTGGILDVLPGSIVSGVMTLFYYSDAFDVMIFLGTTEISRSIPINYFSGLTATFGLTSMTWGIGSCADSENQQIMYNNAPLNKDYTAVWTAGSGLGGRPTGVSLTNATFYYDFLISKPDGTVDGGFDTDINAVNLLADAAGDGFTRFKRTHAHTTQLASTQNELMTQVGREFYFSTYRNDFSSNLTGDRDFLFSISVPLINCLAIVNVRYSGTANAFFATVLDVYSSSVPTKAQSIVTAFSGEQGANADGVFSGALNSRITTEDQMLKISLRQSVNFADLVQLTLGWADYLDT